MTVSGRRVAEVFVRLADTLLEDFDLQEFLHMLAGQSVELLGVGAAGLLLADARGELNVLAASNEQARVLELLQLQREQGPCIDAFRTRRPVRCVDLGEAEGRWPTFAAAARAAGFGSVFAIPLRLRRDVIGALNLFGTRAAELDEDESAIARALAEVATIGILHERTVRRQEQVVEQLQRAVDGRVVIEQAKGVLAQRLGIEVTEAFALLRAYARSHNRKLVDVARAVTERRPEGDEVVVGHRGRRPPRAG